MPMLSLLDCFNYELEPRIMKKNVCRHLSLSVVLVFSFVWMGAYAPQIKDAAKIGGDWNMEVDAGGEYYYLSFTIEEVSGTLTGKISEESGSFTEVKMEKIEFDGLKFSFEMTIPTPPDGMENLVKGAFEFLEEKLEGTLAIEELGMTAYATCTRKK